MHNILITGASGFIGSNLLENLLEDSALNISILTRSGSDLSRIHHLLEKVKNYNIDVCTLDYIFENSKFDGIVHLATCYKKEHSPDDIEQMMLSNVVFPTQLAELAKKHNVKFFINTGTFFEYSRYENPVTEASCLNPFNLYASSKTAFQNVLSYYANSTGMNVLTLKLTAPFGYRDNRKLIPYLINSLLNNQEVVIEKGEQEWDFIYVKDVVTAYKNAIKLCLSSNRSIFEEILVGTSVKTSIKDIVAILNKIHKIELIKLEKDYPDNQIFLSYADNSKARNMLQWTPRYSVEDALIETYNLYKENM